MKKLLLIVLVIALVFVGVVGCAMQNRQGEAPAETPAPTEFVFATEAPAVTTPAPETETTAAGHIDMQALYLSRPADSVYATVGEREISWGEYYEWLGTYILSAEAYMDSMTAYYGAGMSWDEAYDGDITLADDILNSLNENLRAYTGIDVFAAENGISISEEELQTKKLDDMASVLGKEATEEDWAELLVANYLTENIYLAQAKAQLELTAVQEQLYGENGEKLSISTLQHYIEDQGYLHCNHILFLTLDMDTYSALDEDVVAAKKAQAEALAAELQAIEDHDELLARFAELKDEYCEDSGKLYNPDGYLFTPGTMVQIFEDTTASLMDFEVSDPVLSEYGYHIIIRLPIAADTQLDTGGTVGAAAASTKMAEDLDEIVDRLDFTLAPGVEPLNLLDYLVEVADK